MDTATATRELPASLHRFWDGYCAHDAKAMAAAYAPDCRVTLPNIELRGRAEAQALWASWFAAVPDVRSDLLRVAAGDAFFAVEWEEQGTHLGRLRFAGFDLAASGRRFAWHGVSLYTLSPQGIAAHTYHLDRLELFRQLRTGRSPRRRRADGLRPKPTRSERSANAAKPLRYPPMWRMFLLATRATVAQAGSKHA